MYNQVSFFGLIFLFILFAFGCTKSMGQGMALAPSRIFLSGNPGQTLNQQIEISNMGTKTLLLNASLKDWKRDSLGNKLYFEAGSLPASNAKWLEIIPRTIEVLPGAKKSVNIIMHVPADGNTAANVTNSMVFFTQVTEQQPATVQGKGPGVGITIQLEFGVHVYFTPTGLSKKELDFTEFKALDNNVNKDTRTVAIKIKNTGEVVTDAHLRFEMTNKTTGEELKLDPLSISMMPSAEQVVLLTIPPHLKGKFLVVAILDNGTGTNLKIAEKELTYE